MNQVDCAHATDTGRIRDHNEDCYSADPEKGLFIIADGMGGHEGGEVASAIVVRSVRQDVAGGMPLNAALNAAHQNVLKAVRNGIGRPGMGATAVAMQITDRNYQVAWVGDSRAYLWDGSLKRLTRDHSFVQRMMDTGVLTETEARAHPKRNILTQALGAENLTDMTVGTVSGTLSNGQKILLCSDGLTGELEDEEIAAILSRNLPDKACVSELIQAAKNHEGKDNISVILVSSNEKTAGSDKKDDDTLPMDATQVKTLAGQKSVKTAGRAPRPAS